MANLTLKLLLAGLHLAGRKKGLKDLFRLTAEAFGQEPPALRGLSRGEILLDYARFTRAEAEKSLAGGTASAVREKLHDRSAAPGPGYPFQAAHPQPRRRRGRAALPVSPSGHRQGGRCPGRR